MKRLGALRIGISGWAKAKIPTDSMQVDQTGMRVVIAACSGPARLMGPTGPEMFQALRLRSAIRTVMAARPVFSSGATMTFFSSIFSNRPVRLRRAMLRRSLGLVHEIAFVEEEAAAQGGVGIMVVAEELDAADAVRRAPLGGDSVLRVVVRSEIEDALPPGSRRSVSSVEQRRGGMGDCGPGRATMVTRTCLPVTSISPGRTSASRKPWAR